MLFTVRQLSPSIELVFDNADEFINVYPAYHQQGSLIYQNVDRSDWSAVGTRYYWECSNAIINTETVPVIQLVYSYNATDIEKQQQYQAFRTISAVETTDGKLRLYAPTIPTYDFRIRYRTLNKMDLAIPLNRLYGVGVGYTATYEQLVSYLTGLNPISGQTMALSSMIPLATENKSGAMPGGILGRLLKLEDIYNQSLTQPYSITGYASDAAATPITTYYSDIASVQAVSPDTWYKECELRTQTDVSDFTTAEYLFYQQHATVLNITHIYTGNVTTFKHAFAANAYMETIIGLHLLDTHNATDISYMFTENASLKKVDLSPLCLDRVTNIEGLFKNCSVIEEINVSNIDFRYNTTSTSSLIDQPDIFTGIPDDCVIWVGGAEQRDAILSKYPNLTGITYN